MAQQFSYKYKNIKLNVKLFSISQNFIWIKTDRKTQGLKKVLCRM